MYAHKAQEYRREIATPPWVAPRLAIFLGGTMVPLVVGLFLALIGIADSVAFEMDGLRSLMNGHVHVNATFAPDFPNNFLYPYEFGYLVLFVLALPLIVVTARAVAARNGRWGVRWSAITALLILCLVFLTIAAAIKMQASGAEPNFNYGSSSGVVETGWAVVLFGAADLVCWGANVWFRTIDRYAGSNRSRLANQRR